MGLSRLDVYFCQPFNCDHARCMGSVMFPAKNMSAGELIPKEEAKKDAADFLQQFYTSLNK